MKYLFLLTLNFIITSSFLAEAKSENWQGTYYPDGCLSCEAKYTYSPVFKTFQECRGWAEKKMKSKFDKSSCGRNCEYEGKMDMSKCDQVVRSWFIPMLPDSPTFDTYR